MTPKTGSPNRWIWISVLILVAVILLARIFTSDSSSESLSLGPKIGIVTLEGPIIDGTAVIRNLDNMIGRSDVKALVFRINSPGGAVAPSQEIYERVKSINETCPVVVSIGSMAASGGYWAALGSSRIVANPGSVTGSIGVIMDYPIATDLLAKIGLKFETVKSGNLKDSGSPTRAVTEADREYFKSVVQDIHDQFVQVVAENRKLDIAKVRELATGRVYTGRQSLGIGLVDTLGTLQDAVAIAGILGKIDGKPKTVRPPKERPTLIDWIMEDVRTKFWTTFNVSPALRWNGRVK